MLARIYRELFLFSKHIVVFAFFLALTFVILEYVKAYERGDKFAVKPVLLVLQEDESAIEKQTLEDFENFVLSSGDFLAEQKSLVNVEENAEIEAAPAPEKIETLIEKVVPELKEASAAEEEKEDVEEYKLYEEELPQDIVMDTITGDKGAVLEPKDMKDIKDIHIEVAKKPVHFEGEPVIAIVIDDMGISKKRTKDINKLVFPITSSFLTYGGDLDGQIDDSLKSGHEVMAHIPMEAKSNIDTAPDVLKVSMENEKVGVSLNKMLDKFHGINGINNHMGSKFTEDEQKMSEVMKVLKERNLFFLDSRTSSQSVGRKVAEKHEVKYVNRNIFLDNTNDYKYIMEQLAATERVARKKGYAVAIGHPKSQTYQALKDWLPQASKNGFKLVHLSEIVDVLNK